jgi:hypothetical protein
LKREKEIEEELKKDPIKDIVNRFKIRLLRNSHFPDVDRILWHCADNYKSFHIYKKENFFEKIIKGNQEDN